MIERTRTKLSRLLVLTGLLAVAQPATAQVMVAPIAVFMDQGERFGTMVVNNQSPESQEVTIGFRFGYPRSDAAGALRMEFEDSATEARFSAGAWIRAFPRRFALEPGQQQVVRFTVQPPAGLDAGVYWTRIVTTSRPRTPPVDTVSAGVTAQIIFQLEQITTAFYSVGEPTAAVTVATPTATLDTAGVLVASRLTRAAQAPFLGQVVLRVLDGSGAVVYEDRHATSVYFELVERFLVPRDALEPGSYTIELAAIPQRDDIPATDMFPGQPASARTAFTME